MKKETIVKRLTDAKLITKKGKLNAHFVRVAEMFFNATYKRKSYLRYFCNKGGCLQDTDYWRTIELIKALKLNYNTGNEAPQGGIDGYFIYINKSEIRKLQGVNIDDII